MSGQLVSRQAGNGIAPAHPARPAERPFSEAMEVCNAIAGAGDLIPMCYRGKPGAVLLAKMWADRHLAGDVFTALQHIYPIQGRPYVSAEMRVELASAKGYDIHSTMSDEQRCVLRVTDPQGRVSTVAAVMPGVELDPRADITVRPAAEDVRKDNWKNRPGDMLYALACRVADRRLVRSGAALLDVAQDYADEPDVLDELAPQADPEPTADEDVADAELVEDEPAPVPGQAVASADEREAFVLNAALAGGIKRPRVELLKLAQGLGHQVGTIADLVGNPAAYDAVLDHLQDQAQ